MAVYPLKHPTHYSFCHLEMPCEHSYRYQTLTTGIFEIAACEEGTKS